MEKQGENSPLADIDWRAVHAELWQSALDLCEMGLPIFPCAPGDKKPAVIEHLGIKHGFKEWPKFQSIDFVDKVWGELPFNIGIYTGGPVYVVDADTAAAAQNVIDYCHENPTATTARGAHWYFWSHGAELKSYRFARTGCDFKAGGGYVIAPPSVHPSGKRYAWVGGYPRILEPTTWLLNTLKDAEAAQLRSAVMRHPAIEPRLAGETTKYGQKAIDLECQRVAHAGSGERNNTLNRAAFCLGQLVGGGEIVRSEAVSALKSAAKSCGLEEREINATLHHAINDGIKTPRAARRD